MEGEEGNIGKHLNERNERARGCTGPDAESRMPGSEERKKPTCLGEKWRVWKCWSKNEWLDSSIPHENLQAST